jgi:hypothetical protein
MIEISNEDRAESARGAVIAFAKEAGLDRSGDLEHDMQLVVRDLLTNLMHLCDVENFPVASLLTDSIEVYAEEIAEQTGGKVE